jgi:acetolactate synthase-1/2/3 large subunit
MNAGAFLTAALANEDGARQAVESGWNAAEIADWRTLLLAKQQPVSNQPLWVNHGDCGDLFRKIDEGMPANGIIVTDTGLHQLLTRANYSVKSPRGLIFPCDFQSMGFGLPAAIGAALAAPERRVMAIVGDGSFLMVGSELLTAKREQIGLPVLVFCDRSLGLIRNQQLEKSGYDVSTRLEMTDLSAYAKWLGVRFEVADGNLNIQIQTALEQKGPTLIEVQLEDNPELEKARKKAALKTTIKSAIGPKATRLLQRFG